MGFDVLPVCSIARPIGEQIGKIVDGAGAEGPIQCTGIIQPHLQACHADGTGQFACHVAGGVISGQSWVGDLAVPQQETIMVLGYQYGIAARRPAGRDRPTPADPTSGSAR